MSRLQKKKPLSEKRKKSSELTDEASRFAKPVPAAKSAVMAKSDKSGVEPGKENILSRTSEFFREVKVELKKVIWPTRKQTTGTTVVVIIFVFIVAAFLGVFDYSLSKLVQVVLT